MNGKRLFVTILVAALLLLSLISCTVDEDYTTAPSTTPAGTTAPTGTTAAPCAEHKDDNVNMQCDNCSAPLTPGQGVSYEAYTSLTADQQMAFIESFVQMQDFLAWYDVEKTKYDEANRGEDIGGGDINIGDHINGGNSDEEKEEE